MPDSTTYDLIVIGGGAAGFFGALAFAGAAPSRRVLILEKAAAVLAKVRISGGGRCNLTHACFDPADLVRFYPRGAAALRGAFSRFQPSDTMTWFESRGVPLKIEPDGRVFPASNRSETIVDLLTAQAAALGIEVRTLAAVESLQRLPSGAGYTLSLRSGETLTTPAVLLASGGDRAGFALAAGLGHTIVPPVPSLFTFQLADQRLVGLSGVSVPEVILRLPADRIETHGPLLVTHWGLSGPAVLRLSAWGARALFDCQYQAALEINWLPGLNPETAYSRLLAIKNAQPRKKAAADPIGQIPQRLWASLLAAEGVEAQSWGELKQPLLHRLAAALTRGQFAITGKGAFKEEFVTAGGVKLDEVNFKTLQSKHSPGLFLAGEVLDIDGLTGGFNFQNAWTTGFLAGRGAAGFLSQTG